MAIKISGILKDGMGRPIPKCTIELKSKKTSLTVIVETEAKEGINNTGAYSLNVEPGKYAVTLNIFGFPPKHVGEINVYSDSQHGTLNDFLMMPGESDLTPELVLIFQQLRDEARQAANEAKADKDVADSILTDVITVQTDVNEKQQQVNADMIAAGKSKTASAASAKAAFDDAGKTAADVATVAGLKANAETAAQQAELSNISASGHAGRAELAADSVKTLTASADTLAPDSNATAQWNRETNNLSIGVPKGVKGDKGDKGEQGIQGIQGQQGIQGIKGDKGDTGPQAQLSPLLTAISALDTAANQIIYLTGKDATATTALTELGRKLIAASTAETARQEIGAADDSEVLKKSNFIKPGFTMFTMLDEADIAPPWYSINGDRYGVDTPQGMVLRAFSEDFKVRWGIVQTAETISLPSVLQSDGRMPFPRPVNGTSRKTGSVVGDTIRNFTGELGYDPNYGLTTGDRNVSGVFRSYGPSRSSFATGGTGPSLNIMLDVSTVVPTGPENKPLDIGVTWVMYLGV